MLEKKDPEAHEDQFPAKNGAQKAQLLFEGNEHCIPHHYVSDFLYNMPDKLSLFVLPLWTVFCSSDDGNYSEGMTQALSSPRSEAAIKGRIRTALQHFPGSPTGSILVQFWAPEMVGSQIFLATSGLPFGLNVPGIGICWYRKHCMLHKYVIDGNNKNENQFGPPGRVFSRGLPEYNPYVGNYSIKEYPLRDLALRYGAKEYLAIPVFESLGQRCLGVLEALTFYRAGVITITYVSQLRQPFEAVGLKLPDIFLPSLEHDICTFKEIEEGLKEVCEAHSLPLAQIWMARGIEYSEIAVFSIRKKLSYKQSEKYSSFVGACGRSCLREGEGVVGKAFSSFTSCFCKDVTRLSTDEYSLALDACKVKLTSCFAICLRSSYSGYTNYVVELFLPASETATKEPWAFLDSLLATIKHYFRSFKIASGLQLGQELSVEVIRLHEDDELDSFKICQTTKSPPRLSYSANEGQYIRLHSSCQQLALEVDAVTDGRNTVCAEQSIATLPLGQEFPPNEGDTMRLDPPYRGLSLNVNAVRGGGKNVCGPKQNDTGFTLEKEGTVKTSDWKDKITFEVLEQHFGKKLEDVAKSLDVSRSTFKRVCRKNNIFRWPSCKREIKHSLSVIAAKKRIVKHSSGDRIPHSTTMQNENSMTIKARYGADVIKFDLFFSSTMMELVDKVAKRFKLQADDCFKAKYQDEDNDMILLACDEDLQKCLSTMRSLDRPIVHVIIEPTNNV